MVDWMLVTLASSAVIYVTEFMLDVWQTQHLSKGMPPALAKTITGRAFERVRAQSKVGVSFNRLESTFGFSMECLVLLSGFLVTLWPVSEGLAERLFVWAGWEVHERAVGITWLLLVSLLSALVKVPFQLYRILHVEGGHSSQGDGAPSRARLLRSWVVDQLKVLVISVAAGVPIVYTILWLLDASKEHEWLLNWFFMALLSVTITDLYSTVMAPFFFNHVPLPAGELRERLEELTRDLDCPVSEIYVIDASDHNAHSNAYFQGVGSSRAIVLYDTLVNLMSTDEILAIVAHEMGHVKHNHFWKTVLLEFASMGVFFKIMTSLVHNPEFYHAFGFTDVHDAVGILLFSYMYSPFASLIHLAKNLASQRFELDADVFAINHGHSIQTALTKLHLSTFSNLCTDWRYCIYHYSHPSLEQRLTHIEEVEAKNK